MECSIKIIRSARRRKTVSAKLVNGVLEVRVPAGISDKELQPIIDNLQRRLQERQRKRQLNETSDLARRAQELNQRYFDGELRIKRIEYVTNQEKRFGSCTTTSGIIRISDRVARLPEWVVDYVLIHEIAHLKVPNHSREFWALVNRYPLAERARGYLMALSLAEESS
jgi:predicted metal-dependent hydrolase